MRLELESRVACTDAAFGELVDVVVDPVARSVTHLVVEPRRGRGSARLVPVELAETGGERERTVVLRLTVGEVRELPAADDVAYARLGDLPADDPLSDVGVQDVVALSRYPAHDQRADVIRLTATANPFAGRAEPRPLDVALQYDRIPKGKVELRRGSAVRSADGRRLGRVTGLVVAADGGITEVVLEHGRPPGLREVTLPVDAVAAFETDGVTLRLTIDEVRALPSVPAAPRPPARRRS